VPRAAGMQAQDLGLFQAALGLSDPWEVVSVEFDPAAKRLDVRVDFAKGARFACPECGREGCPVHDTEEMSAITESSPVLITEIPQVGSA
jgi:hypothetical protein